MHAEVQTLRRDTVSELPVTDFWSSLFFIAIQEALDGKAVEWMEKVSAEQYFAGSQPK